MLNWALLFLMPPGDPKEASLKAKSLQICALMNTLCPALVSPRSSGFGMLLTKSFVAVKAGKEA